jgi:flagellar basal-body rod protein FlgB
MSLPLLQLAASRLGYLGQTQRLLAQNIANLDTPGYSAKTTEPFKTFLTGGGSLPLAETNPADIAPTVDTVALVQNQAPDARGLDGNAVSLDQQLASVSSNDLSQEFAVNLYQSYLGMFRTALGPTP